MTKLTNVGLAQMAAEPADVDRLYIVDDPAGSPTSKYIEYGDLASNLAKLDVDNTFAGDVISGSGEAYRSIDNDNLKISGGSSTTSGGNVLLYGGTHATYPGWVHLREGSTERLTINGDGLVGINDTSPVSQLDITTSTVSTVGIIANVMSAGTASAQEWHYNSGMRMRIRARAAETTLYLADVDYGSEVTGAQIYLGRNTNSGLEAPGNINFKQADGGNSFVYSDDSGIMRVHTSEPINSTIGSGTVIGDQTSNESLKDIIGDGATGSEALNYITEAIKDSGRFRYKSGAYNNEIFDGLIIRNGNGLQRYGKDADKKHDGGKALNVINAISDLMKVVVMQADQINNLRAQILQLQGA